MGEVQSICFMCPRCSVEPLPTSTQEEIATCNCKVSAQDHKLRKWTSNVVRIFLSILVSYKEEFACSKNRANIYQRTLDEMKLQNEISLDWTVEYIKKKLSNLTVQYKKLKDANYSTRQGRHTWEFFDLMDELNNVRMAKIENYVEIVVPLYRDNTFKDHFRLTRLKCDDLAEAIGPHFERLKLQISIQKFILVCLWTLGSQDSYRDIGDRFGIAKSSVSRCIQKFTAVVSQNLMGHIIWPRNLELFQSLNGFRNMGFPNAVCAIDGCHIKIEKPLRNDDCPNPIDYCNRKSVHSINMLAGCSSNLKLTFIYVGAPGSFHDARVLRLSDLGHALEENPGMLLNDNNYILADSAYALTQYVMTPFRNNGQLTAEQRRYNRIHASARNVIQRTFGLLKMRFRRLLHLNMHNLESTANAIKACCILHNICVDPNDVNIDLDLQEVDEADIEQEPGAPAQRAVGVAIRNEIANSL